MTMALKVNLFLLSLVAIILVVSLQVERVLPPYLPNVMNGNMGRSNLIKRYCELGLSYKEVLLFLLMHHGIRLVKKLGIKRSRDASDLRDVIFAIIIIRSNHRLKRKRYVNKASNYLWHMDGYDV